MRLKLLIATTALFAIAIVAFVIVDHKVARKLQNRSTDQIPAIYGDALTIRGNAPFPIETFKTALENRRYRLGDAKKLNPGEYTVEGAVFNIALNEYRNPDGSIHNTNQIQFNVADGLITTSDKATLDAFALEPEVISYFGNGDLRASKYKPLSEIPKNIQNAVIAIEDERFYKHLGIDPIGISRAMFRNIKAMGFVEGGSTLTQQLAKNLILSPRKTLGRKLKEALAALSLERRLSKDQILELYLNEIYLGQEGAVAIHGVPEAAKTFFGKELDEVTLAEAALLAGMVKAPSSYSPRKHFERALERKDLVIDKMAELGYIKPEEAKRAHKTKIQVIEKTLHQKIAPHFVTSLSQQLEQQFDMDSAVVSGLSVYTGINADMQRCAESAVSNGLDELEKKYKKLRRSGNRLQGALVAIEPFSGKIRAWAGGRDYSENQFDHVTQASRQMGSTMKPFLYLTALDKNLNNYKVATPTTILSDEPLQVDLVTHKTWSPENYDRKFRGDVTLRYALENSLNIPAAYVGQKIGIPNLVNTIKKFRIADNLIPVPALALGAVDTTLLRLTTAYAGLANGGIYVEPRPFISAVNSDGEILATSKIFEEREADENSVFVLTNILQGVLERGTGKSVRSLGYTRVAAGKTGTTNETRDAWFVGFTPNLSAGVWIGVDDNSKIGLTGGVAATPIWTAFMKCAQPFHEDMEFLPPSGVSLVNIDQQSNERASADCPPDQIFQEVYVRGTEPNICHIHGEPGQDVEPGDDRGREREDRPLPRRRKSLWDSLFG